MWGGGGETRSSSGVGGRNLEKMYVVRNGRREGVGVGDIAMDW